MFSTVAISPVESPTGEVSFQMQTEFPAREALAFDFSALHGIDAKLLSAQVIPSHRPGFTVLVLTFDSDPHLGEFSKKRTSFDRL